MMKLYAPTVAFWLFVFPALVHGWQELNLDTLKAHNDTSFHFRIKSAKYNKCWTPVVHTDATYIRIQDCDVGNGDQVFYYDVSRGVFPNVLRPTMCIFMGFNWLNLTPCDGSVSNKIAYVRDWITLPHGTLYNTAVNKCAIAQTDDWVRPTTCNSNDDSFHMLISDFPTPEPTPRPSKAPTPAPSKAPTPSPTAKPVTDSPSTSPTDDAMDVTVTAEPKATDVTVTVPTGGSASGDPHFRRFSGQKFDFHGGCDLVLLHNPAFANNLGLTVHLRTKIETFWSSIDTAVLAIGPGRLEVQGSQADAGSYWINGNQPKLEDRATMSLSGFPVVYRRISNKQIRFRIDLGNGDAISMETYNKFVSVNVHATNQDQFESSVGLLGKFPSGAMLDRQGQVMIDANAFGQEWQVLETEPLLFHSVEGPQHPQACTMPDDNETARQKRRLGESMIGEEDAALACARVSDLNRDNCIFDVLATNDKDMAGAY